MSKQNCIALKINRLIVQNRSTALASANDKDTKELWALLRKTGNWCVNKQSVSNIDDNVINEFFANIATDPNYRCADVIQTTVQPLRRPYNFFKYGVDNIERMLARIRRTSPGNDNIPYWV